MSEVQREYIALDPIIRRLLRRIDDAPLGAMDRAALMTLVAAHFMSMSGAMMAAIDNGRTGKREVNILEWTEASAKTIVQILRDREASKNPSA